MSSQHHDLLHEFPEHKERIHELKVENKRFAKLFNEYHKIGKELHRIEQEIETPDDRYVEGLKKMRLLLKDELFVIVSSAAMA